MSSHFEDELNRIRRTPVAVDVLGEVPARGGVYIWWCLPRAIPHVPSHPIRSTGIDALHVGAAAGTSAATSLRQKIDDDMHRSIERSRFRLDLALLLKGTLSLQVSRTKQGKPLLAAADNEVLAQWQRSNLMLTWELVDEPRALAAEVIAMLHPPLNLPYRGWDAFWEPFLTSTRRF